MKDVYGPLIVRLIEKRLAAMPYPERLTKELDPEETVRTIYSFPCIQLPSVVRQFVDDYEAGRIGAIPGANRKSAVPRLRDEIIRTNYNRYLIYLRRRKKGQGLKGWGVLHRADWWQGPPGERAARMANRKASLISGLPELSLGHVRNMVGRSKSRPR